MKKQRNPRSRIDAAPRAESFRIFDIGMSVDFFIVITVPVTVLYLEIIGSHERVKFEIWLSKLEWRAISRSFIVI